MQRPLYNQLVPYYEIVEGRDWNREVKLLASILRNHRASSVVDLGCGTGYHVRALTRFGFDATGVDISRQNIQFARKRAKREGIRSQFVMGSYYEYRPRKAVDAALCLNWSIPTRDAEITRLLSNTRSMLRLGGLLILDYERTSEIVWAQVGKPIINSWKTKDMVIVRASLGRVISNVLYSRDTYILYPIGKNSRHKIPDERSRYRVTGRVNLVKTYVDSSYVRFFSIRELQSFASRTGFRLITNHVLPRNGYKRNYAVLKRFS